MKLIHFQVDMEITAKGTHMQYRKLIIGFSTEVAIARATLSAADQFGKPLEIRGVTVKRVKPRVIEVSGGTHN